jgi:hypothetical protein
MSCLFDSSLGASECNRNFAEGNLKVKFQSRDSNKGETTWSEHTVTVPFQIKDDKNNFVLNLVCNGNITQTIRLEDCVVDKFGDDNIFKLNFHRDNTVILFKCPSESLRNNWVDKLQLIVEVAKDKDNKLKSKHQKPNHSSSSSSDEVDNDYVEFLRRNGITYKADCSVFNDQTQNGNDSGSDDAAMSVDVDTDATLAGNDSNGSISTVQEEEMYGVEVEDESWKDGTANNHTGDTLSLSGENDDMNRQNGTNHAGDTDTKHITTECINTNDTDERVLQLHESQNTVDNEVEQCRADLLVEARRTGNGMYSLLYLLTSLLLVVVWGVKTLVAVNLQLFVYLPYRVVRVLYRAMMGDKQRK